MVPSARFLDVGSERERVLRVLQLTGDVPLYPWSIRGFSPAEWDWLTPRSPNGRALLPPESRQRTFEGARVEWLPLEVGAIYNSAFPFGYNDGALWAGKGITGFASAGVAGRVGPLSFQLEPIVFDASNGSFPLKPNGTPGNPFMDGFSPGGIDLPQRFGNSSYRRFDFGQSSVRLDLGPAVVELSTADQWWGPAIESPLLLGNNAPGFPHMALGTSHPVNIGIGRLQARLVWGRLDQSAYSPDQGPDSIRFVSSVIGVFMPRGVPGLELGVARFYHTPWPENGLRAAPFLRPFEGILASSLATSTNPSGYNPDNQLASVFARWTFPGSHFEAYAEYGREDHNADLRDFWQEIDHDAAYTLGFQRAWPRSDGIVVLRGELMNSRLSHLQEGRDEGAWYIHGGAGTALAQGHTVRGQLLGAAGGYGGGAATLAVDRYSADGRWTFELGRIMRGEARGNGGLPQQNRADAMIHAGAEIERTLMERALPRVTILARAVTVWDLNRDFIRDQFNLNLATALRATW